MIRIYALAICLVLCTTFLCSQPRILTTVANPLGVQQSAVQLHTQVLQTIMQTKPASIVADVPLFDGTEEVLLQRSHIVDFKTRFVMGTALGDVPFNGLDCALPYEGTLRNGARVILTVTQNEIMGLVFQDGIAHPITKQTQQGFYTLADGTPDKFTLNCSTDEHTISKDILEMMNTIASGKQKASLQSDELLTIEVALDADYYYYGRFSNDSVKAASYLLTLFAASSAIFVHDVNAQFAITYVRIWKNITPYGATVYDVAKYWRQNMKSVQYDAVHFLSGSSSAGGGVAARIGGICSDSGSFARSSLNLDFKSATVYSYDLFVVSHEFGHVFGSAHTHSCLWRDGQIDNCGPTESGPCTFTKPKPLKGTIMSYCSQTSIGVALEFHPMCKQMIRTFLERSACTGNPANAEYTHALRGNVVDGFGQPLAGIQLRIRPMRLYYWEGTPVPLKDSVCTTTADGDYEFKDVASGFYYVVFPDNYRLFNSFAGEDETTYVQKCMIMIQDSDVSKNWILDRKVGVYCTYPQATGNPTLMVLPLSNMLSSIKQVTITAKASPQLLTLTTGKYLIVPYLPGVEFNPPYRIISIANTTTSADVNFTSAYKTGVKYFGIVVERNKNNVQLGNVLTNRTVAFGTNATDLNQTAITDSNGVYIFAAPTATTYYCALPNTDTTVTYVESNILNTYPTTINVFMQRPRKAPFVHKYLFDSYMGEFSDISASIGKVSFSVATGDAVTSLPFAFKYGNSMLSSLRLYDYGAASFGYTEVIPNSFYPPTLNYRLPTDGILGLAHSSFRSFDTSRTTTATTAVVGTAPNRVFIVQWNFRYKYNYDSLRFVSQLRLYETSNTIEFIYGKCISNTSVFNNAMVGLQGTDSYDMHTRTSTTSWTNTTRATIPTTQGIVMGIGYLPPQGLVYRWRDTVSAPLDVQEQPTYHGYSLAPNPVTDEAIIRCPQNNTAPIQINVINTFGEVIATQQLRQPTNDIVLHTDAFAQGAYTVQICTDKTIVTLPMIVVR